MKSLKQKYLAVPLWGWIFLAVMLFASLIIYAIIKPEYGTWRYGACKTLLETTARFPSSLEIIGVGEAAQSATIAYSDINAYGTKQIKIFECHYVSDAQGNIRLSRVVQNRRPVADTVLADLNKRLPIILTQELDTRLPEPIPSNLKKIRR